MVKKYLSRFKHAINGLLYATASDFGFRSQVYLGAVIGFLVSAFYTPLTASEFLFVTLAWALILITELQNSALEAALDRIHTELHDSIKHSKDMAAASVLIAGLFLLLTLITISYGRFI